MKTYFISVHLFKKVNPKRFNQFDFFKIESKDEFRLYMDDDMIVKFADNFYQYKGMKQYESIIPIPAVINVKDGKNLLFSMDAN